MWHVTHDILHVTLVYINVCMCTFIYFFYPFIKMYFSICTFAFFSIPFSSFQYLYILLNTFMCVCVCVLFYWFLHSPLILLLIFAFFCILLHPFAYFCIWVPIYAYFFHTFACLQTSKQRRLNCLKLLINEDYDPKVFLR